MSPVASAAPGPAAPSAAARTPAKAAARERTLSPVTAAATRFVADHRAAAEALGDRLADLVTVPDEFAAELLRGFRDLADPLVPEGIRSVTPGLGPVLGVRLPLLSAAHRRFLRGTRRAPTTLVLDCVERALRSEWSDVRWFGMWTFERLLPTDPERTWQLMRGCAATASEWITVDTLAHPYGAGVVLDQRRWAELGQLIYSPSRWERRLVGSTVATLPHVKSVRAGREPELAERCLGLLGQLIGDAEPDVQKALSWALRSMAELDPAATLAFVERETAAAVAAPDGHRAWVLRDSLPKLAPADAARIRASLEGIRRRPGAPSTSRAAAAIAAFAATGSMGSPARGAAPEE